MRNLSPQNKWAISHLVFVSARSLAKVSDQTAAHSNWSQSTDSDFRTPIWTRVLRSDWISAAAICRLWDGSKVEMLNFSL